MTTAALKLTEVSKSFPVGRRLLGGHRGFVDAVRPISLTVEKGKTTGVVGESGCGKSTLARMLVGLLKPTAGTIEIEGRRFDNADSAEFGRRIQYVFQDPISSLNPRKTIRQTMETPLRRLHGLAKPQRDRRIAEIFDSVNLRTEFLDRYPHEFSGGQAQRIVIARALAAEARILVLDEPVSALDVSIQAQVLNLLSDLKQEYGLTYLFISHDLAVDRGRERQNRRALFRFGRRVRLRRDCVPRTAAPVHATSRRERACRRTASGGAGGNGHGPAGPLQPPDGLFLRGALSIANRKVHQGGTLSCRIGGHAGRMPPSLELRAGPGHRRDRAVCAKPAGRPACGHRACAARSLRGECGRAHMRDHRGPRGQRPRLPRPRAHRGGGEPRNLPALDACPQIPSGRP